MAIGWNASKYMDEGDAEPMDECPQCHFGITTKAHCGICFVDLCYECTDEHYKTHHSKGD